MGELMAISELRPTQLTVGEREVARRQDQVAALTRRKRDAYIAARPVPCVVGPKGKLYLIDRHHMCRALLGAGEAQVMVDRIADASHLGRSEFWTWMDLRNLVHPFDADGMRRTADDLGRNVADLVDDPYRGLAGFLRREKGFTKEDAPFEEFVWADFLRRRITRKQLARDYDAALRRAIELAHSDDARHMPGWRADGAT